MDNLNILWWLNNRIRGYFRFFVIRLERSVSRRLERFISCSHKLNLLEFHAFEAKVVCHLNNLPEVYEIAWVGTEPLYAGVKLTATHSLWYCKAEPTFTIRLIAPTEFTNYHVLVFRALAQLCR